jgi:hypothetical protein
MLMRAALLILCVATSNLGQITPGPPYEPDTHPNPILTFLEPDDFSPTTYQGATDTADIDLLGLFSSAGSRQALAIAVGRVHKIKILGRNTAVLFYPTVRQKFGLSGDGTMVLYSFKSPKPDIPPKYVESVLNEHVFRDEKDPRKRRFGPSTPAEKTEIRGVPALLFDNDGTLTLFWIGDGKSHVAVSSVDRNVLFRMVEDLL